MRVIAISDLHRGQSLNLAAFRGFLEWVRQERPDRFLLLGDIHELAWFVWEHLQADPIAREALDHLRLVAEDIPTVELCGNHDPWERLSPHLQELAPILVRGEPTLELDGVIYTHGHQFDITTHFWDTALRSPMKRLAPWLYLRLYGTPYEVKTAQREKDYREYVGWIMGRAMLYAIRHKDLCFGHTHAPMTLDLGGRVIVNSGDWQDSLSYIEAIDGRMVLRFWKGGEHGISAN